MIYNNKISAQIILTTIIIMIKVYPFIYHDLHALVTLASCALRVATLGLTVRRPARIITGTTDGQLTILLVISFAPFEI